MDVMQAWGITPDVWRKLSVEDRAQMMAHEMIKGRREAYRTKDLAKPPKAEKEESDLQKLRRRYGFTK